MIQVRNISKTYNGNTIIDGLSFEVKEGETLVLLGTSGSGKTTTLKMLNRLVEADSGTILIRDRDIRSEPLHQLRKNIGYVIQNVGLFPHYSVAQNIGLVPGLLHWDKKRIARRTAELMEMVGLDPAQYQDRKPMTLSGGQRQRVGIARALAADPDLVLMDEPFGALDPINRKQLRSEFKNLESALKKTVVLVTHDVQEAFQLGDRICLLSQGKIQQIGTPKALIFNPANAHVRDFFKEYQLQLQMEALYLSDLASCLAHPVPSHLQKESVYALLNDEVLLRKETLTAKQVVEAFYTVREHYPSL